jgi:hypothetical protein
MHGLLQERNETIKVLEIAKVNGEISMWNLEKKLKAKEDVEGMREKSSGKVCV